MAPIPSVSDHGSDGSYEEKHGASRAHMAQNWALVPLRLPKEDDFQAEDDFPTSPNNYLSFDDSDNIPAGDNLKAEEDVQAEKRPQEDDDSRFYQEENGMRPSTTTPVGIMGGNRRPPPLSGVQFLNPPVSQRYTPPPSRSSSASFPIQRRLLPSPSRSQYKAYNRLPRSPKYCPPAFETDSEDSFSLLNNGYCSDENSINQHSSISQHGHERLPNHPSISRSQEVHASHLPRFARVKSRQCSRSFPSRRQHLHRLHSETPDEDSDYELPHPLPKKSIRQDIQDSDDQKEAFRRIFDDEESAQTMTGITWPIEAIQKEIANYKEGLNKEFQRQKEQDKANNLNWEYENRVYEAEKRAAEETAKRLQFEDELRIRRGRLEQVERHALLQESAKNALIQYCQGLEKHLERNEHNLKLAKADWQETILEAVHQNEKSHSVDDPSSWTWFPRGVLSEEFLKEQDIGYTVELEGVCIPMALYENERRLLIVRSNDFQGLEHTLNVTCPVLIKELDGQLTITPACNDDQSDTAWVSEEDNRSQVLATDQHLLPGYADPMFLAFWVQCELHGEITEKTHRIPKIFGFVPELHSLCDETSTHFTLLRDVMPESLQKTAKAAFTKINTLLPRLLVCEEVLFAKGLAYTKLPLDFLVHDMLDHGMVMDLIEATEENENRTLTIPKYHLPETREFHLTEALNRHGISFSDEGSKFIFHQALPREIVQDILAPSIGDSGDRFNFIEVQLANATVTTRLMPLICPLSRIGTGLSDLVFSHKSLPLPLPGITSKMRDGRLPNNRLADRGIQVSRCPGSVLSPYGRKSYYDNTRNRHLGVETGTHGPLTPPSTASSETSLPDFHHTNPSSRAVQLPKIWTAEYNEYPETQESLAWNKMRQGPNRAAINPRQTQLQGHIESPQAENTSEFEGNINGEDFLSDVSSPESITLPEAPEAPPDTPKAHESPLSFFTPNQRESTSDFGAKSPDQFAQKDLQLRALSISIASLFSKVLTPSMPAVKVFPLVDGYGDNFDVHDAIPTEAELEAATIPKTESSPEAPQMDCEKWFRQFMSLPWPTNMSVSRSPTGNATVKNTYIQPMLATLPDRLSDVIGQLAEESDRKIATLKITPLDFPKPPSRPTPLSPDMLQRNKGIMEHLSQLADMVKDAGNEHKISNYRLRHKTGQQKLDCLNLIDITQRRRSKQRKQLKRKELEWDEEKASYTTIIDDLRKDIRKMEETRLRERMASAPPPLNPQYFPPQYSSFHPGYPFQIPQPGPQLPQYGVKIVPFPPASIPQSHGPPPGGASQNFKPRNGNSANPTNPSIPTEINKVPPSPKFYPPPRFQTAGTLFGPTESHRPGVHPMPEFQTEEDYLHPIYGGPSTPAIRTQPVSPERPPKITENPPVGSKTVKSQLSPGESTVKNFHGESLAEELKFKPAEIRNELDINNSHSTAVDRPTNVLTRRNRQISGKTQSNSMNQGDNSAHLAPNDLKVDKEDDAKKRSKAPVRSGSTDSTFAKVKRTASVLKNGLQSVGESMGVIPVALSQAEPKFSSNPPSVLEKPVLGTDTACGPIRTGSPKNFEPEVKEHNQANQEPVLAPLSQPTSDIFQRPRLTETPFQSRQLSLVGDSSNGKSLRNSGYDNYQPRFSRSRSKHTEARSHSRYSEDRSRSRMRRSSSRRSRNCSPPREYSTDRALVVYQPDSSHIRERRTGPSVQDPIRPLHSSRYIPVPYVQPIYYQSTYQYNDQYHTPLPYHQSQNLVPPEPAPETVHMNIPTPVHNSGRPRVSSYTPPTSVNQPPNISYFTQVVPSAGPFHDIASDTTRFIYLLFPDDTAVAKDQFMLDRIRIDTGLGITDKYLFDKIRKEYFRIRHSKWSFRGVKEIRFAKFTKTNSLLEIFDDARSFESGQWSARSELLTAFESPSTVRSLRSWIHCLTDFASAKPQLQQSPIGQTQYSQQTGYPTLVAPSMDNLSGSGLYFIEGWFKWRILSAVFIIIAFSILLGVLWGVFIDAEQGIAAGSYVIAVCSVFLGYLAFSCGSVMR